MTKPFKGRQLSPAFLVIAGAGAAAAASTYNTAPKIVAEIEIAEAATHYGHCYVGH